MREATADNSRVDLVAAGDAGIQIGEFIQKDMVAVRVSRRRVGVAFVVEQHAAPHFASGALLPAPPGVTL